MKSKQPIRGKVSRDYNMNALQLKLKKRKLLEEFVAENDLATTRDESLTTINYAIKTNSHLRASGRRWPPCFPRHCTARWALLIVLTRRYVCVVFY